MTEVKDIADNIAEVYARSLLDLAVENDLADAIDEEFGSLVAYMKTDSDFDAFMTSAAIDDDDRRASLEKLFRGKMNDLLLAALQVLNNRRRAEIVRAVYESYHHLLAEQRGKLDVYVTSAEPLTGPLTEQLQAELSAYTGKQAVLVSEINPDVLGGLVIRIGDQQIDTSVRRKLQRLRTAFTERAGKEIHTLKP